VEIILHDIETSVDEGAQAVVPRAAAMLGLRADETVSLRLYKTSVDARRGHVRFVGSVAVQADEKILRRVTEKGLRHTRSEHEPLVFSRGEKKLAARPGVGGVGPAGIAAARVLAKNGYRPVVLERGGSMDERVRAVHGFWESGCLDEETNVQFGEGGAGAFSDGKLTTRINSPLCAHILAHLVRHGAPGEILTQAKPHIGTDRLRAVVTSLRREIIDCGGEIHFHTRADEFLTRLGRLPAIRPPAGEIAADAAVVAVGHSARDTFGALARCGVFIAPKAFSVGVRIEHLQRDIDRALYGKFCGHPNLPPASYQLSYREQDRAAYTFCMCPGGMVVAAASQNGRVVTNGMSYHARGLPNANSALAVSVGPKDFGPDWQCAVSFQERLEQAAYEAGGGGFSAPVQTVGALLGTARFGAKIEPSYPLGVKETDILALFPEQVRKMLLHALPVFGKRLAGFDSPSAVLTAVETRTSSPVRLTRNEAYMAQDVQGLYPCAEGAGYAGGIMSAAADGVLCAAALMKRCAPFSG
jgi:uncharacterized FAD-dependent dehydrogenase